MSFFELPPPPPEEPQSWVAPSWLGPPDNVFGVPFPLALLLARTESAALQVHTGMAYPSGIEFTLQLAQRERTRGRGRGLDPIHSWHMPQQEGEGLAPEVLRFGVALADGRKATVFDQRPRSFDDDAEPDIVLMQRGGGGGDRRYDMRFWLWPLPPPGPLAFVVEWPAQGIPLTRHEVDTAPMLDAAARAEPLWPDGSPSGGGWTRQVAVSRSTKRRDHS